MFKITVLALVIALCNAEKEQSSSRLLLQAAGTPPATGGVPPAQAQPAVPAQPTQPAPYNPYGQQQAYNPYPSLNNMANPYCNPMSGMYDMQDCLQYGAFYGNGFAAPAYGPYGNPGIVGNPGPNPYFGLDPYFGFGMAPQAPAAPAAPATPGAGGAAPARPATPANPINPMNPYCNPYSGMYDLQDCYRFSYGVFW